MTRDEAIKFANCLKNNYTIDFNDMADFCDIVIKALEQQPKTEGARGDIPLQQTIPKMPQQKTGHWILTDDDFVYCSECEDSYYPRPIDASWYYCPHCGARMEEEK